MGKLKTYLIHWHPPIGNSQNPHGCASHYLGCTDRSLIERFQEHARGQGAKITRGAILQGREILLVRYWNGGWSIEKIIKKRHNSKFYCPICNPKQLSTYAKLITYSLPKLSNTFLRYLIRLVQFS